MNWRIRFAVILFLFSLNSIIAREQIEKDSREIVAEKNDQFAQAVAHGDAAGLAAFHTSEILLPPNRESISGLDAITGFFQH